MTRYTINIGDEFPLNDERPGASGRRWGWVLRALFGLSVAAIIVSHPFHAAILFGLALLVRRSDWFAQAKLRWRQGAARRQEMWRTQGCGARWTDRREGQRDRYKAFV